MVRTLLLSIRRSFSGFWLPPLPELHLGAPTAAIPVRLLATQPCEVQRRAPRVIDGDPSQVVDALQPRPRPRPRVIDGDPSQVADALQPRPRPRATQRDRLDARPKKDAPCMCVDNHRSPLNGISSTECSAAPRVLQTASGVSSLGPQSIMLGPRAILLRLLSHQACLKSSLGSKVLTCSWHRSIYWLSEPPITVRMTTIVVTTTLDDNDDDCYRDDDDDTHDDDDVDKY